MLKTDFTNAFNSISKQLIIDAVAKKCPEILKLVEFRYHNLKVIFIDSTGCLIVEVTTEVIQGDVLLSFLFQLAISYLFENLRKSYKSLASYLDDNINPTKNHLEKQHLLLQTLRKTCGGKLHVLFGCGGQRDVGKRGLMGDIANELADYVIVTDDNPREENANLIRQQILKFCPKGKEVEGRANAIKFAMDNLRDNDILVIAGKGHEDYQLIGKNKIHFSDFEEVANFNKNIR